ncbi:extracellular solute-binding protein [Paenibacillus mendelii]|uniref:Extracellular solute-binding protein n=1 Tax=Paenibacillus mendelii TaxID=206163 RepID=A0ABV6JLX4_9BACL|nr:extracellular solute-binding protein [Paenibacillus mendelii]MCQ6558422.1 extracellular solute-binding protein [Paenibacillus mendelii]
MKKKMSIILSSLLSLSLILGACSQQEETPEAASPSIVTEAGSLPITQEKTTLTVLMYGNSLVENFATNEYTKWLEEKTNIHIVWEVAPEKSAQEKLNITLAGGDYPDVIMGFNVSPVQMSLYGKDGVFIPLNNLIDKYGVETKKMFNEVSYAKETITAPDGNIYGLPQVNECYHCTMSQKMWINQGWLTKLGLQMPTTTDEYYEVLKAFKENDPNGNGKKDEIPLAGYVNSGPEMFLMSAFVEKDMNDMIVQNGKIDVAFTQPRWKEGLTYMRKLYAEGLLAPETFTQDLNGIKKLSGNPEMILGSAPSNFSGSFLPSSDRVKDYAAVPPLTGPSGMKSVSLNPYGLSQGVYIITNKAENPEAAFRLADFMYSEEATMRAIFGRPDQEWVKGSAGDVSIASEPAKWKRVVTLTGLQNYGWSQTGPSLRTSAFRLSEAAEPGTQETILYEETKQKYESSKLDVDKVVPPLFFTKDQSEELAGLTKTITDYKKEFMARAVTGDIDVEKEWDGYLKKLDGMNLKRFIQIYQEAYDAKKKG